MIIAFGQNHAITRPCVNCVITKNLDVPSSIREDHNVVDILSSISTPSGSDTAAGHPCFTANIWEQVWRRSANENPCLHPFVHKIVLSDQLGSGQVATYRLCGAEYQVSFSLLKFWTPRKQAVSSGAVHSLNTCGTGKYYGTTYRHLAHYPWPYTFGAT